MDTLYSSPRLAEQEIPINFSVYSTQTCSWCVRAKDLLKSKNIAFKEFTVGKDITIEQFQEKIGPNQPLTVPKIFDKMNLIGGYPELVEYLK